MRTVPVTSVSLSAVLNACGVIGHWVVLLSLVAAAPAEAQNTLHFRVHSWQPPSAQLTKELPGEPSRPLPAQQTALANEELGLSGNNASQTLVQIQPSEGGDARFMALGGQRPRCLAIGQGWIEAKSGEAPWYKTLFALLGAQSSGVRVSASSVGTTRGGSTGQSLPKAQDACGLYPTAEGVVYLVSGQFQLTLGSSLPSGTQVTLTRSSVNAEKIVTEVTQGQLHWPRRTWIAGDRWHIVYAPLIAAPNTITYSRSCDTDIVVQPQEANPLKIAHRNSPRFDADEATVLTTLVSAQLDDPNLSAWHAWLLGTIAPVEPAAPDLGATLWRVWWGQRSKAQSTGNPSVQ